MYKSKDAAIPDKADITFLPEVRLKTIENSEQAIPDADKTASGINLAASQKQPLRCHLLRLHRWVYRNPYYRTCDACSRKEIRSGFGDSLTNIYGTWVQVPSLTVAGEKNGLADSPA